MAKKLGLTPLEVAIMNLTMGGGRKNYGEIGYMASSMFRWTIPEPFFRPRFLELCAKAIVTFEHWSHFKVNIKMRPVVITRRGAQCIADIGMRETEGRNLEEWRWHKMFDPFENYAKNPHKLDRFLPGKIQMPGRTRRQQAELNDRIHAQLAKERLAGGQRNDLVFD